VPDVYLPRDRANGWPYCFDPASAPLRAAISRKRFEETEPLDAAALAGDVRDLHEAMKRLYAGYPELLQTTAFDVDGFFADWEREVRAAAPTVTFGAGVLSRLVTLRRQIHDNHLATRGHGRSLASRPEIVFSEYQRRGHVDGLQADRCTFTVAAEGRPTASGEKDSGSVLPIEGTVAPSKDLTKSGIEEIATFSVQSIAPSVDVRCGAETVRFERRTPHQLAHEGGARPYEWRTSGGATVIVVRRLYGSPEDLAALERLAKDYDEHRKKPLVVFDFRGNGGGNDGYVWAWVERATRGKFAAPYAELQIASATACGDWNNLVADQITYGRVDSPEARAERDAFLRKSPLGGTPGKTVPVLDRSDVETKGQHPYGGRVLVLVDHASASSGESGPLMLRAALRATIVGERTGGYAEFGNIRPYVMPRTGVVWQLASKRNYYPTPHDGVGLPVDYYLSDELIGAPVEALIPVLETIPKR
jgi:hypothetical protein